MAGGLIALVVGLAAGQAEASTTIYVVDDETEFGTIVCSGACKGLLDDGSPRTLSGSRADIFSQPGGGQDADKVADYLRSLTDVTFTDGIRSNMGGGILDGAGNNDDEASLTSGAEWIAFKFGTNYAFLKNVSASEITYTWTKKDGKGLSNVTEFGAVNVIPLPAAGWLLLGGLGALGVLGRWRRTAG